MTVGLISKCSVAGFRDLAIPTNIIDRFEFSIPLTPPSANNYKHYGKRFGGGKGYYLTPQAEKFRTDCILLARSAAVKQNLELPLSFGRLAYALEITFYFGRRVLDIDNGLKMLADCLQDAGLILNDRYVTDCQLHKRIDARNPRTVVCITGGCDMHSYP